MLDTRGNLTGAGTLGTFTYDSKNRLLTASSGANTMTVAYDYRNRPVSRTINGTMTYLIHDGWNLIEELDDTGDLEVAYIHGPMIDELLAKIDTTGTVYYHHDGLGSTIALTDDTGDPVENYTYDVFGAVTILDPLTLASRPSTACSNRFLFTGREHRQSGDSGVDSAAAGPEGRDERERASQWLAEVALYDYRNRIYHSELGRFLQIDPIRFDAGDVNLYRYVGNDSVNWVDPSGMAAGARLLGGRLVQGQGRRPMTEFPPLGGPIHQSSNMLLVDQREKTDELGCCVYIECIYEGSRGGWAAVGGGTPVQNSLIVECDRECPATNGMAPYSSSNNGFPPAGPRPWDLNSAGPAGLHDR